MSRDFMNDQVEVWWDSYTDQWERLFDIAKMVIAKNPDAELYDLFSFIRERCFGAQPLDDESVSIRRMDAEIAYEHVRSIR